MTWHILGHNCYGFLCSNYVPLSPVDGDNGLVVHIRVEMLKEINA